MDPLVLGGIIGGAGSLFGNLFNAKSQKDAGKYNADLAYKASQNEIAWARQQQQIANNFNLAMWNRQNEYNTPQMQMQRLKDAGLNPALMYSQGNTGNAQSSPTFESVQPSPNAFRAGADAVPFVLPELGNVLNHMFSTLGAAIDVENKKKQGMLMDSQIDNLKSRTFLDNIRGVYLGQDYESRLRDSLQTFLLKGGSITDDDAYKINRYVMDSYRLSNKKQASQIDMFNAFKGKALQDILVGKKRIKDLDAALKLKKMQEEVQSSKVHEYNTVYRKYNELLGPFRPVAESAGSEALDIVGSIIEAYFTKGGSAVIKALNRLGKEKK